ncbi:ATP-dependent zinc protease [Candidatus Woesearchaeota archaeon]|nr:ATP-dependent zinc protease [Candidatus Woesearchaeota archaeon]
MSHRITVGLTARVILFGKTGRKEVVARIDTGATKSSIDSKLATELEIAGEFKRVLVKSASGSLHRGVVVADISIGGEIRAAEFTLADRTHLKYRVLIGQNILKKGFLVDPSKP